MIYTVQIGSPSSNLPDNIKYKEYFLESICGRDYTGHLWLFDHQQAIPLAV
jgi:hypothetical protein